MTNNFARFPHFMRHCTCLYCRVYNRQSRVAVLSQMDLAFAYILGYYAASTGNRFPASRVNALFSSSSARRPWTFGRGLCLLRCLEAKGSLVHSHSVVSQKKVILHCTFAETSILFLNFSAFYPYFTYLLLVPLFVFTLRINAIYIDQWLMCFYWVPATLNCIDGFIDSDF
jgi:hypothetical protein